MLTFSLRRPAGLVLAVSLLSISVLLVVGAGGGEVCKTAMTEEPKDGFQPYRMGPPADWDGPVFQLFTDYPRCGAPVADAETPPWEGIQFGEPARYLWALLDYAFEDPQLPFDWGELAPDPGATSPRWFHAPWLNYGGNGREFVHGLTRERDARPGDLHPRQKDRFQTWAVSVYNAAGGRGLDCVWWDPERPRVPADFPEGSFAIKLLFTEATVDQVPYLRGSPVWRAHIHRGWDKKFPGNLDRTIREVRLLQVDVAAKEDRSESGWVFGTFIYHASVPERDPWRRLLPVGLSWGPGLDEGWLNPVAKRALIEPLRCVGLRKDFGWEGRVNGMADNRTSSCHSCHASAQVWSDEAWNASRPRLDLLMTPLAGLSAEQAEDWFELVRSGESFVPEAAKATPDFADLAPHLLASTDYSLQVMLAIDNCRRARVCQASSDDADLIQLFGVDTSKTMVELDFGLGEVQGVETDGRSYRDGN